MMGVLHAFHVTFQVLLVSPALLQWARLSRGRLSLNFLLSSERLVAFLIGVKKSEIHNDHEVNFLTASELSEGTPPLKQVLFLRSSASSPPSTDAA